MLKFLALRMTRISTLCRAFLLVRVYLEPWLVGGFSLEVS